jgi:hypothetical protein
MAIRNNTPILYVASLFITLAALIIPQAVSQESRPPATPLKDVCPQGWSRYNAGVGFRLCVSPDVEARGDFKNSELCKIASCNVDYNLVPDAWSHATAEEVGYLHAEGGGEYGGYHFYVRVVNVDSSTTEEQLKKALDINGELESYQHGSSEYTPFYRGMSLAAYGIPAPPEAPGAEVCPPHWARFSCQFVRLCVSPSVASEYNLAESKNFDCAQCKPDNHSVPASETYLTPEDVGFFAGALLNGPRYFKSVKLDSSDIFDGNMEEAILRLVLVPIPTSGLMDYDRGFAKGQEMFKGYLAKNGHKN